MGFFDKHNRQLRKKMQDLRVELDRMERTGDYIVERGVYFASLPQMGDQTHMALAHGGYAEEEIDVLRRFFNRNGFTCEDLRLDLNHGQVSTILLIPPNEMIKSMILVMQAEDYKVVDDSDQPLEFDVDRRICPVSGLAKVLAFLFVRRVRDIIAHSEVKLTREGSRLLHWMPEIIVVMRPSIKQELIYATEMIFDEAFEHFYERKLERVAKGNSDSSTSFKNRLDEITGGKDLESFSMTQLFPQNIADIYSGAVPEKDAPPVPAPKVEATSSPISFEDFQFDEVPEEIQARKRPRKAAEPAPPPRKVREPKPVSLPVTPVHDPEPEPEHESIREPEPFVIERTQSRKADPDSREIPAPATPDSGELEPQTRRTRPASITVEELHIIKMSERLGKTTTCLYEALVRAEPRNYPKTAATLIDLVNRHFRATAGCIIARAEQGGMEIMAQAGRDRLTLGGGDGYPVNLDIVKQAGKSQKGQLGIVLPDGYCLVHPIHYRNRIFAVLYVMRPTQRGRYRVEHIAMLQRICRIFEDFPDLTLGLNP